METEDRHGADGRLTDQEMDVLNRIGDAYAAFAELEPYHPLDHDEFVFHVHAMGRIVLARSAMRAHPERNWIRAGSEPSVSSD